MNFRSKSEKKAHLLPKFRTAIKKMQERDVRASFQKPVGVEESAEITLKKFEVLNKMMSEVVSLMRVHCGDTAQMMQSIWETQARMFRTSNKDMKRVFAENIALNKHAKRLEEERDVYRTHAEATISSLNDRIVLLHADLDDAVVKSRVWQRQLHDRTEEINGLRKIVSSAPKDVESIESTVEAFETNFDALENESRKQIQMMLDLEDELTSKTQSS
eukprot:g1753.t1